MTVNRTTLLDLPLPVTGTESGTWGDTTNNGLTQYVDIAVAGMTSLTSANFTAGALTLANTTGDSSATNIAASSAQYGAIKVSSLGVASTITAPSSNRRYVVINADATYNLTFKASGQTGVTIVPGEKAFVAFNGTDYVKVGGAAGGSTTQVQYNNAGVFGGITNATTDGTTLSMTSPKVITSINDTNGNELFKVTATGSAVNEFTVANAATGAGPTLSATGSDTNIAINLTPKGSGQVTVTNDALVNTVRVGLGAGAVSTNTAVGVSALAANSTGSLNTAVGYQAGYSNTTGTDNAFLGHLSGYSNTTASGNTGVGRLALYSNQTGTDNTAHGREALKNTTGSNNTAVGSNALVTNTTGDNNTAVGHVAFASNTTGSNSVAVGMYAGNSHTTGARNTFVGGQAGRYTTSATDNVAMGYTSLWANTTGLYNVAVGVDALRSNTTANNNTAVGYQSLYSNTTGAQNTAVGVTALQSNTTGVYNHAFGYDAANATSTGSYNIAIGGRAYKLNTTGAHSVAIGYEALYSNTTGAYNTAVGNYALADNTTGTNNVALGYQALGDNTTGADNVAVGYAALDACTTGIDNVAVGSGALGASTTASYNVAIGKNALNSITTATANVVIGNTAGTNVTGAGNVIVGEGAVSSSAGDSYSIVIGRVNGSNITGKGSSTGFVNPDNGGVYQGNNSSSWSTTSDRRLKKNIVDNNEGLDKISQIRVRNFEYRLPEEVDAELKPQDAIQKTGIQLGVIAQELQEVCPDCVKEESTGVLSVDSDNVFWHMVNAIKQLKTELDSVKAELATLKGA